MSQASFSRQAEQDILEIADFIAKDNSLAAADFLELMIEKCNALASHPGIGRQRPEFATGSYRSFPVGNYVIFYKQTNDGIAIARVLHGARDLDVLLGR